MAKAGRPKAVERKTTLSINENLSGWLEFRGREYSRGLSGYLNALAERDREQVLAEGGELSERYKAFCAAVEYDSELESLSK